jgi:two-component system NtrC family sensor kinase
MLEGTSLRWRIVAVLLLASLLPLALAGFGAWVTFGNLLEDKALDQMKTLVQSHARAIEANLQERIHLLTILATSHSFKEVSNPSRLKAFLDDLNQTSTNGFVDLGIIDADGRHIAYMGPYDLHDRNYQEADWFKEVMARGVFISDVFLGFRQVPHCIIAVKTSENNRFWIVRATISSRQFDDLVTSGDLGNGNDAYIINRDALYQTTPRGGAVLDRAPIPTVTFHPGVRDNRMIVNDTTEIQVTTWINDNRWMLVVQRDLASVRAPVNRAITKGAQLVVVAVVLLIVTTFFATRHLTDRIDKANAQRDQMTRAFMRSAKLASIGELATGLAHEINNPLAIISAEQTNISDVIKDLNALPDREETIIKSVERSKNQIQRCAGITRKMLQFGRNRETTLEATEIAPRLEEIVGLLRRRASVRNVDITITITEELPSVFIDPVELEQILVNLIHNSLDAMPDGGLIEIRAYKERNNVHLEVADNGTGIPPEELDRIFEPYFTTKPVGKGTGLGLSVCFGIVHSWGGRITAESKPGEGTTMHIILPIQDDNRHFNKS